MRIIGGLPDPEPPGDDWWQWRYYGLPSGGFELILELDSSKSLRVRALDFSYGLPGLSVDGPAPRPPGMMPDPGALTDVTVAVRNFEI